MLSFGEFYDKVNGPMYQDIPPPVRYNTISYADEITTSALSNVEGGTSELKPISHEDTGRYAADDVVAMYKQMHKGDPRSLGPQMTDGQFKKFMGHTW